MDIGIPGAGVVPLGNTAAQTAMVFVRDRDSEGVIRQCLSDLSVQSPEIRNGGINEAIADLKNRSSPRLLIVDIQGVEDAVAHVRDLADVCEPETGVIVIGDVNDIRVYRSLKAAGVVEYFFKPLVRDLVMQTCNGILTGSSDQPASRAGKLVFTLGVRGGVGATTVAVATAFYLAESLKRRVGLVDLDLHFGDAALQLDAAPTHALREALDHPERVDELFLERGMTRVGERLGVLAALEPLQESFTVDEAAVHSLLEHLLHRYRYVFVDLPASVAPGLTQVLHLPATTLLVSTASLVCARDVARLRERLGPNSAERTTIHVLNKGGASDSLSNEEFNGAAGAAPEVVIPNAREIASASRLGAKGLQKCSTLQRSLAPLLRQLSGEGFGTERRSLLRRFLR
jgi:pilus assembly protein CpaE